MICPKCKCDIIIDAALYCPFCGKKISVTKKAIRRRGNGTGTSYKRGKTWTATYTVGWRMDEKKKRLVPVKRTKGGFRTKQDALEYIPKLKIAKKQYKKLTFLEVYELWKVFHEKKVGKSTMDCYKAAYKYFKPLHYVNFADIGLDDLQDCVDECGKGRRTRENMKALGTLLYSYALPRELAAMDYAHYLDVGVNDKTKRKPFTAEQIEIIRKSIDKVPYADYIYCMIYTGFRPNEFLQLTKDESYNATEDTLTGGFKTEAGTNRVVPISPKILPIVQRRAAIDSPYLFPRGDGTLMGDDYFRENYFYPALAQMGIQPIPSADEKPVLTPYSTRHTFSDLMKKIPGYDTDKAALMGHTSYEMTVSYQSKDLTSMRQITSSL